MELISDLIGQSQNPSAFPLANFTTYAEASKGVRRHTAYHCFCYVHYVF